LISSKWKYLTLYLTSFFGPFGGSTIAIMIPVLKESFSVSITTVLLVNTLYMLPYGFFQIFSGVLSDHYGRSRIILFGCILYSIGALGCAFSPNIEFLITSRFFQGCGVAFVFPIALPLAADLAKPYERKSIVGRLVAVQQTGQMLGPSIAGFLVMVDWRLVFLLMATFSVVSSLFTRAIRVTVDTGQEETIQSIIKKTFNSARNRTLQFLCFSGFVLSLCTSGIQNLLGDALSTGPLLLEKYQIGLVFTAVGLSGIAATQIFSRLSNKIGTKNTYLLGFCMLSFAHLLYVIADSFFSLLPAAMANGFGIALMFIPLQLSLIEVLPSAKGTASSLYSSFRFTAIALSPLLLSPFYTSFGMITVFLINSLLLILCIVPVQLIFPKKEQL